jgi:hypothetical protein
MMTNSPMKRVPAVEITVLKEIWEVHQPGSFTVSGCGCPVRDPPIRTSLACSTFAPVAVALWV